MWLSALRGTPVGLRLLTSDTSPSATNLDAEVRAAGLSARRLSTWRFARDKRVHVARHTRLGLVLDTAPLYGSHTTAADAALAGAPLLTLPADGWASRVAASVDAAAGAPECAGSRTKRGWADLARALLSARALPLDEQLRRRQRGGTV